MFILPGELLRMPLDAYQERMIRLFDCFDNAVGGSPADAQAGGGIPDSLMVKAVNFQ